MNARASAASPNSQKAPGASFNGSSSSTCLPEAEEIHYACPTYNARMPISARNKLKGKIEEIQMGDVMAHVVVRVGENLIESAITRRSADELQLKKGDTVFAVVKATEVMIQKD
jgi:molybdopterin-binding protein